jgi:hypothetical protein
MRIFSLFCLMMFSLIFSATASVPQCFLTKDSSENCGEEVVSVPPKFLLEFTGEATELDWKDLRLITEIAERKPEKIKIISYGFSNSGSITEARKVAFRRAVKALCSYN